jgi:hypothetical protein
MTDDTPEGLNSALLPASIRHQHLRMTVITGSGRRFVQVP